MKKFAILFTMLMTLVLSLSSAACATSLPYNTVLYDSAVLWIKEDFQNNNLIKVIGFNDDNTENNLPSSRTFIVDNSDYFESIFIDDFSEFEVDFDSEMIIVYTFGIEYVLPAKIKKMTLSDKTLTVNYKIQTIPGTGSACQPFQRWFVIKMDKLDISSVQFVEV